MNSRRFVVLTLAFCVLASCVGCANQTLKVGYYPGAATAPTLPCPVALGLSKEFTSYQYVKPASFFLGHGAITVPFGPALKEYATYVAQSVFGDVQVLDGQSPRGDAKLLLVPRVTSSDLEQGSQNPAWPASGALGVQWDFNDPKTGQTLVSMHLQCEAKATHSVETYSQIFAGMGIGDVVPVLMTNLTSITIRRFNASKDIQHLSGH